ncbi:MAG: hypothetical protein HGA65_16360 [Oscillochloris sp.]|nr:hypothetical protein [Oscillochloris sp.]
MQYPVSLALEDYLTVIFSAIGMILLTKMVLQLDRRLGQMALIGTTLTVVGGLMKATAKLIMSMGGPEIPLLVYGLFPLIAPGFTLLGWSLFQVRHMFQNKPVSKNPWLVPSILIGVFAVGSIALAAVGGPWRVPLILLSSLANISLLIMLSLASWGRGLRVASVLFIVTLIVVLVMSQLAGKPITDLRVVWFEQLSQSLAQALFAVGAWQYGEAILATYRRPALQMA